MIPPIFLELFGVVLSLLCRYRVFLGVSLLKRYTIIVCFVLLYLLTNSLATPLFFSSPILPKKKPENITFELPKNYFHSGTHNSKHYLTKVLSNKLTQPYAFRGPADWVLESYRSKQIQGMERALYFVVIDAGSTKTNADLWRTTVQYKPAERPSVNWRRMELLTNLGKRENLRSFYTEHAGITDVELQIKTAELLCPLFIEAQKQIMRRVGNTSRSFYDLVPDIPVIVHSTAGLRDMDIKIRRTLFHRINFVINGALETDEIVQSALALMKYKENGKAYTIGKQHERIKRSPITTRFNLIHPETNETKTMRFFTTLRYCRAITGIEEAVFTFMTANLVTGVVKGMQQDDNTKNRLGGILEVGGASMQVVFPVQNKIHNGPLGTLDLTFNDRFFRRDMFPRMVEGFNVFATSYMNLGINRALALLQKQYCQTKVTPEGYCYFPCFQKGWRQQCIPGNPVVNVNKSENLSPFQLDAYNRIVMEGNNLWETANFCSLDNPLIRNMLTPRSDCRRAGFNLKMKNTTSRAQIHQCSEIIGTGDANKCYEIIGDFLFRSELPGNQETLSDSGAAAPVEIGQFMAPKGIMYVVGNSLVFPITQLKKWKMLKEEYYITKENPFRQRCDFTHLQEAAQLFCGLTLSPLHTFINPITNNTISLDIYNFDYCYKSIYAVALLDAINVIKGDVQVQFEGKIKHVETEQVLDFGWTYGALTNLILDPKFVTDLFVLGPTYYRASKYTP